MKVLKILVLSILLIESGPAPRRGEGFYIAIALAPIFLLVIVDALIGGNWPDLGMFGPVLLGIAFVVFARTHIIVGIVAFLQACILIRQDPAIFD